MAMLGDAAGAESIGANVTRVPPGKATFALHHHPANEEHFFILSGTGVLRVGDGEEGDRVAEIVARASPRA